MTGSEALAVLEAAEPLIAEHIGPIMVTMANFVSESGKPTNPDVWIRAMRDAILYIETLKADGVWLAEIPVHR